MEAWKLQKLLPSLETALIHEIVEKSSLIEAPGETPLVEAGSYIHSVPLVVNGTIRVSRREDDRELLLYYIYPGELCIMSFSACCSNSASMVIATTTETTELLLMPSLEVRKWLSEYPTLNTYIYQLFNNRYLDLIETINQLVFFNLDDRILSYLEEKSRQQKSNSISVTHQQIANDLGTAREVVSRLMKKLERDGLIEQGRNLVLVNNLPFS